MTWLQNSTNTIKCGIKFHQCHELRCTTNKNFKN